MITTRHDTVRIDTTPHRPETTQSLVERRLEFDPWGAEWYVTLDDYTTTHASLADAIERYKEPQQ